MLRGLTKARPRQPVFLGRKLVRASLSPDVLDAFWAAAEIMSEGAIQHGEAGDAAAPAGSEAEPAAVYFGSTMVTVALERLAVALGLETLEPEVARVVCDLLEASPLVRARLSRTARQEARVRVPGAELGRAVTETRFRLAQGRLEIDIDIEATTEDPRVAPRSRARRARGSAAP